MLFTLIFITSLLVVAFAIPPIITVSYRKRLFDDPCETRKAHTRITPNFGGIAIFSGFLFSSALFIPAYMLPQANVLMAGGLVLFMTGLKDDIIGLSPAIKFVAQFSSAFIVAVVADLRIASLHGIFDFQEIPYFASILLTVLFIVGIVNAFNLIDGIDGLAASLGMIVTLFYACAFFKAGEFGWAYLSIALTGALVGFLFFNVSPARIFMGDSGSLMIGFITAILSLKFVRAETIHSIFIGPMHINSGAGMVVGVLIIPIFDTLRVFTLRILNKKSPFTADSNHLHHRLLSLGLSHMQATLVLSVSSVMFVVMALMFQQLSNAQLIGLIFSSMLAANGLLTLYIARHKRSLIRASNLVLPANDDQSQIERSAAIKRSYAEEILEKISEN